MQNNFTSNYTTSENKIYSVLYLEKGSLLQASVLLKIFCSLQSSATNSALCHTTQQMCVSRCLHCVGISLIPMAIICMVCNSLLLFPNLKANFLLEGHVTREATWSTGLWGSGFVVCLHAFVCDAKQ